MRILFFFLVAFSSFSAIAQHYVIKPPAPVSNKLYDDNPQPKKVATASTAYRSYLINEIHSRVRLHEYHRGKSCQLFFTIDFANRRLLELSVSDCTMGRDFEQELSKVIAQAIYVTPIPNDSVALIASSFQAFNFIPRFDGTARSNKPSSFSKTYVNPHK